MRALPCVLALLLGVGAALLVSCGGSSGQIPANDAAQLKDHLDGIGAAVAGRDCQAADAALARARTDLANLDALGAKIAGRLRSNLRDGVDKLEASAAIECEKAATTPTQTQTIETTTTAVPTQTEPTVTVPTETATNTVPPADTTTVPVPPVPTTTTPSGTGGVTPDPGGGTGTGATGPGGKAP